jgi:hypothetical protein
MVKREFYFLGFDREWYVMRFWHSGLFNCSAGEYLA